MLSPHTQAHRAAAIYLIYGLYFKQPLVEKVRVRINLCPTDPFVVLESLNQEIHELYIV